MYDFKKITLGLERRFSELTALVALAENLGLVLNTHRATTLVPGGHNTLFWVLRALAMTHTHCGTYTSIKIKYK